MSTDQYELTDPTKMYADIETRKQTQPSPGLDAKLRDRADLGESSYRGTGRLKGRKALITGGDSGIGAATAIAFARRGPTWPSPISRRRRPMRTGSSS